jgi:hypothetical protein
MNTDKSFAFGFLRSTPACCRQELHKLAQIFRFDTLGIFNGYNRKKVSRKIELALAFEFSRIEASLFEINLR